MDNAKLTSVIVDNDVITGSTSDVITDSTLFPLPPVMAQACLILTLRRAFSVMMSGKVL